jgi:hypothetical protein
MHAQFLSSHPLLQFGAQRPSVKLLPSLFDDTQHWEHIQLKLWQLKSRKCRWQECQLSSESQTASWNGYSQETSLQNGIVCGNTSIQIFCQRGWRSWRRFQNPQPEDQINIPDSTATELATYSFWAWQFDQDEARWLAKEKALQNLTLEIVQTIDVKHLDLILSCADAYDQLKTLKKYLRLSIGEKNHQLRA